jgi:hypothetical protein
MPGPESCNSFPCHLLGCFPHNEVNNFISIIANFHRLKSAKELDVATKYCSMHGTVLFMKTELEVGRMENNFLQVTKISFEGN